VKAYSWLLCLTMVFFSAPVNSYYTSGSSDPMIKMMSIMLEMMSRLMMGNSWNTASSMFPYSAMPVNNFPMSPASPFTAMSGLYDPSSFTNLTQNPALSGFSQLNPLQQAITAKSLEEKLLNQKNNAQGQSMNGIWQAMSGDIMAIYYDNQFIWTDGKSRHLAGKLMFKQDQLSIYVNATKTLMNFQFYRENDNFAVKDSQGQLYVFKRIY